MTDVTLILAQIEQGDTAAAEKLLPLVYSELRKLARAKLAHEPPGQTLQATALVHEAYLRLIGGGDEPRTWRSRNHFFAAAAEAMRRILVDAARRKAAVKYGGQHVRIPLAEGEVRTAAPPEEILAVHDALDRLALDDAAACELVKMHYFGGFSIEEAAELLAMSRATAYRTWTYARTWLKATLRDELGTSP
jgi:RNA polymerase sigma factor (TIGR02999 family)